MVESTGYGRGWREPKARGLGRIRQIMHEPAGYLTYVVCAAIMVVAVAALMLR